MTISSQQFGQQTISVVLNEGQMPAKMSTDSNGNTVLVGPDGAPLSLGGGNVSNEAELQQAIVSGVTAKLSGNVVLTKGISLKNDAHIDLNGYTLSAGGTHNFNMLTTRDRKSVV